MNSNQQRFLSQIVSEIKPFTAEEIIAYATQALPTALSSKQKAKITNALATKAELIQLAELINLFQAIQSNPSLNLGLTDKDLKKLKQLIDNRKKQKELYEKGLMEAKDYRQFLALEKSILPFDKRIEWWKKNTESLNNPKVWSNISTLIKTQNTTNAESDATISQRSQKLQPLYEAWFKQNRYALISNEQLLDFYQTQIIGLEKKLNGLKNHSKKYPQAIIDFANYELDALFILKEKILFAMLYRLQATEFFQDLKADDIVLFTSLKIARECGIKNVIPTPEKVRHGLKPNLLKAFNQHLKAYASNFPNSSLAFQYQQLNQQRQSTAWLQLMDNSKASFSLTFNPICTYFVNQFTPLFEEVNKIQNLNCMLIDNQLINDNQFVLLRLHSLVAMANVELNNLLVEYPQFKDHLQAKALSMRIEKYQIFIQELSLSINFHCQNACESLVADAFSLKEITEERLKNHIIECNNVKVFNKKILKEDQQKHTDILIAIAKRFKNLCLNGKPITTNLLNQSLFLLNKFNPTVDGEQAALLKTILYALPKKLALYDKEQSQHLLHYILSSLEKPLLGTDHFQEANLRHQQFNDDYSQNWQVVPSELNVFTDIDKESLEKIAYLKNVLIPQLKLIPDINCETFSQNDATNLLMDAYAKISILKGKIPAETWQAITEYLDGLRDQIETILAERLSSSAMLTDYLYDTNKNTISLEKLVSYYEAVNTWFKNTKQKQKISQELTTVSLNLTKKYLLANLKTNKPLTIDYINTILQCTNNTNLAEFFNDIDIQKLLTLQISLYSGNETLFHQYCLSILTAANNNKAHQLLLQYTRKRFDYLLLTNEVCAEDFALFNACIKLPTLQETCQHFLKQMQQKIAARYKPEQPWDAELARCIELAGDDTSKEQYRFKRITELLNLCLATKKPEDLSGQLYQDFVANLNYDPTTTATLINPNAAINPTTKLVAFLAQLIQHKWSPLLDAIANVCGCDQELKNQHTAMLSLYIDKNYVFSNTWLGQQIDSAKSLNDAQKAIFYLNFFGRNNIESLLAKLESILTQLVNYNASNSLSNLNSESLQHIAALIHCIKPLTDFFNLFSNNSNLKTIFMNLDDLLHNINLHHELSALTNESKGLVKLNSQNLKLNNAILTLTQAIIKIEGIGMLTEQNANAFLDFLVNDIFSIIINHLEAEQTNLDFDALTILLNLLMHLPAFSFKKLLIQANQKEIRLNPQLENLIKNLGDATITSNTEKLLILNLADKQLNLNTQSLLTFAKSFSHLQKLTKQQLIRSLFQSSNCTLPKNNRQNYAAGLTECSNEQLLTLWQKTADKLLKNNFILQTKAELMQILLSTLQEVSNHLLKRAETDENLVVALSGELYRLPAISKNLSANITKDQNNELEKNYQLLVIAMQQIYNYHLLHLINNFIKTLIPSNKQALWQALCQREAERQDTTFTLTDAEIAAHLGLKNSTSIYKIKNCLQLYKLLAQMRNAQTLAALICRLQELQAQAQREKSLKNNKNYLKLLSIINDVLTIYLQTKSAQIYPRLETYQFPHSNHLTFKFFGCCRKLSSENFTVESQFTSKATP